MLATVKTWGVGELSGHDSTEGTRVTLGAIPKRNGARAANVARKAESMRHLFSRGL
jgi:hypothetical protein